MEQPRKPFFTTKSLIVLMLPIMAEYMLTQLVGMVDGVMVSSVGEAAISAVSLVTSVSAVVLNLLVALAGGGSILTSQLIGANDMKAAKQSTGQVISMSLMVGGGIGLACILFSRPLLHAIFNDVEQVVLDNAVTYFFYDALSYPLLALCSAGGAILRAQKKSKTVFYISILRNVINVTGNAICIHGLKMGVAGVAIPTAISRLVGAVVIMLIVTGKDMPIRPETKDIFHINPRMMRKMMAIGIPTAIENSLFSLGKVMTLDMISGFGTAQIAANSAGNGLTGLVITFSAAIRIGAMNVIGQCVGAHDEKQINENFRKLMIMSYIANAAAAIPALLFRHQLVGLYTGLSPEAAAIAAELLVIHLIPGLFLYATSFFIPSPLRAANDGAFCMWVSIASMVILRLSLAWVLCVKFGMGAKGVWIAMVIDWACRSVCFLWRWLGGYWKKKCGIEDDRQEAASLKG